MKKLFKLFTVIAPLSLCGCDFNFLSALSSDKSEKPQETNSNDVSNETNGQSQGETSTTEQSQSAHEATNEEQSSSNTPTNTPSNEETHTPSTEPEVDPNENNTPGTSEDTPTDPVTPSTPVVNEDPQEEKDGTVLRIYFTEAYYSVKTTKASYLTVEIEYADGYDYENCGDELEWSIEDTSIATVNVNGKVEGKKKGSTIIKAHMKVSNLTAQAKLFVIESESDIQKSWKKMGSTDHIEEKDTIIIACPEEGKAATAEYVGHKLHSTSVGFNSDKSQITNVGSAAQFYVYSDYKDRGGYNVELLDGDKGQFLHASNTANVWFDSTAKSSNSRWDISWDKENDCWDMRPATNVDGWMMYNKDIDKFANYQSNATDFMYVVSLYRLTYTFNV